MRKIAIFTGNRAEYGLQFPIIKAVAAHPDLEYYLLVSGAHLDQDFGKTVEEINKDGFEVYREVKIEMVDDNLLATAKAIGSGILSLAEVLAELKPDVLVVYADRFEGFAAVVTGTQMGIRTAHIEGGDITEGGALDDSVRHAMTKLAHLHFTTNEEAADRVRAMGEEPWRVFNVGFPAIDLISEGNFATPAELEQRYGLDLDHPIILFTQHAVATQFEDAANQVAPALAALSRIASDGVQVVATYPNNDAGGRRIIDAMQAWYGAGIPGIQLHRSLGRYNYHGILSLCGLDRPGGACVGNSSSGIKETPAFGCPAVNIGSRQLGRLRADNVVDAAYDCEEILEAMRKCTFDTRFRVSCKSIQNPYGQGDAGQKIAKTLAEIDLKPGFVVKRMTI